MMAKIQLYINRSLRGLHSLLVLNASEKVACHVHDYRDAMCAIMYEGNRTVAVYLLSYVEDGSMITILKPLSSDYTNDFIAATLFFPAGIDVNSEERLKLVGTVERHITLRDNQLATNDAAYLADIFDTDYNMVDLPAYKLPSLAAGAYAFAYFSQGKHTMIEYCRSGFYQPYFAKFAGVLLLDADAGVRGRDPRNDLTRPVLPTSTILLPPDESPTGFKPFIYDIPFTRPMFVPADANVEVLWQHPGFEPVSQWVHTEHGAPRQAPTPVIDNARKTVSVDSFYVLSDATNERLGSFTIKVNGVNIETPVVFDYIDLLNAKVDVTAPGFMPFSGLMDLASTPVALVTLEPQRLIYRLDIPLIGVNGNSSVRIYLKTDEKIKESPLEGYIVENDKIVEGAGVINRLCYVGSTPKRTIRIAAAAGGALFLLGLLAGILIG